MLVSWKSNTEWVQEYVWKKKVQQGTIGNVKGFKTTCLYAYLNIYNVCVITSTQVVKNEKENMHTPRCNFLRRSSHNLWTGHFVNNSSQHMNLYKKQHLFWNHKESANFNNTYMYRVWKETCTVLYLHSEIIDRRNAWQLWQACIGGECSVLLCNMYQWGHSWLASLIVTSF